ncbi:DUF624 domain-containing protein [Micrococcales bacterium 31B]|nr:DUF624 domain-containing protein [Micrococcales bacterium 31B]
MNTSPGNPGPTGPLSPGGGPPDGALTRVTQAVYLYLVVEGCFVLAALPGIAMLLFLRRDASNLPLYLLGVAFLLPALSAAFAALASARRGDDEATWPRYWRAYRANWRDTLKVFVPVLVVALLLGWNITFARASGLSGVFTGVSYALLTIMVIVGVNALVLLSLFSFRARDTARLAVMYCFAKPLRTLGIVSLLALAGGLVVLVGDWVFVVFASVFAGLLLSNARAMCEDVAARFVEPDAAEPQ